MFISKYYEKFTKSEKMTKNLQDLVILWTNRPLALNTNFSEENQ